MLPTSFEFVISMDTNFRVSLPSTWVTNVNPLLLFLYFPFPKPVPCTELGPAAQDVCANGFSYATSIEDSNTASITTATTSSSSSALAADGTTEMDVTSSSAQESGATKRTITGRRKTSYDSHTTADPESAADVPGGDSTGKDDGAVVKANVAFGNDSKRIKPEGGTLARGPNKTGKTDAEKVQLRAYLRQGVDR